MKKIVCVVLAVIAVFALAACKKDSGDEVIYKKLPAICRVMNPIEGITASVEMDKWNYEPFTAENRAENVTLSIGGEDISGKYQNTTYVIWTHDLMHTYKVSEDVSFSVDDAGKLVSYTAAAPASGDNVIDKNSAETIARDFIRAFYPDANLADYTVTVTRDDTAKTFKVSAIKYIGDVITLDNAITTISETGAVLSFECSLFGKVPKDAAAEIDFDLVEGELLAKCKSVSKKAEKTYASVVTDPYTYILTLDENGAPAIVAIAIIYCRNTYDIVLTENSETLVLYFANDLLKQ